MVKRIGKVLGAILLFAIITFIFARFTYQDYADNWEPSTEVAQFEYYFFFYASLLASVLFIFTFIRWAVKMIRGKT